MAKDNTSSLDKNMASSPMSYDLHSGIMPKDLIAGLRYGRKLNKKIAEAMKKAGEEYESSKQR